MSLHPHEKEEEALYRLIEAHSSKLLAKVRAILLRPHIKEEILTYIEGEIERTVARDSSLAWMRETKLTMDEKREQEVPSGRVQALPTIWVDVRMPTGYQLRGKLTLTTFEDGPSTERDGDQE